MGSGLLNLSPKSNGEDIEGACNTRSNSKENESSARLFSPMGKIEKPHARQQRKKLRFPKT